MRQATEESVSHGLDHTGEPGPTQRQLLVRWGMTVLLLGAVVVAVSWWLGPGLLRRAQAERILRDYLHQDPAERDLLDLEELLLPLAPEAALALGDAVARTGSVELLHAFEYMDPAVSRPIMARLWRHPDPDLRHGALLGLARLRGLSREELLEVAGAPTEDRFIRLAAAHQLGLDPDWCTEVEGGEPPVAPRGMPSRRITYQRILVTLPELVQEIAWVTGGTVSMPPEADRVLLEEVHYVHVELGGMIADLQLRTGGYRLQLTSRGDLVVEGP